VDRRGFLELWLAKIPSDSINRTRFEHPPVTDAGIPTPTHVLVFGALQFPDREQLAILHESVDAALPFADRVDLHLDPDRISGISADPLVAASEAFDLVADTHYRGDIEEDATPVRRLLDVDDWREVAAIERVELSADGRPVLEYVPDDRRLDVDAGRVEGPVEAIEDAIGDRPAGLLATTSLVRWRLDGHEYDLAPPDLSVDGVGFDLSKLASVHLDESRKRIGLAWDAGDQGFLSRLTSRLGPSRPTTLDFESYPEYERVALEFERIAEPLGLLRE
jgi:hypothetical protein